jgi:hypothetical protein
VARKSTITIERTYSDNPADWEEVAEALVKVLTSKGRQIREYILDRNLPDGGRGYAVMGAYVNPKDGHAYETPFHGETIDHGQVTEPGPVERVEKARERWYKFGL